MNRVSFLFALALCALAFGLPLRAMATVITFDDVAVDPSFGYTEISGTSYAGLSWGTNGIGFWGVLDTTGGPLVGWAAPHSDGQIASPASGVDAMTFTFAAPVTFNGAWFSRPLTVATPAASVQFGDDLGDFSSVLKLKDGPQFLPANWSGATTITVYRFVAPETSQGWFSMDDVTYNEPVPEPGAGLLMLMGMAPMGLAWVRRRKSA